MSAPRCRASTGTGKSTADGGIQAASRCSSVATRRQPRLEGSIFPFLASFPFFDLVLLKHREITANMVSTQGTRYLGTVTRPEASQTAAQTVNAEPGTTHNPEARPALTSTSCSLAQLQLGPNRHPSRAPLTLTNQIRLLLHSRISTTHTTESTASSLPSPYSSFTAHPLQPGARPRWRSTSTTATRSRR